MIVYKNIKDYYPASSIKGCCKDFVVITLEELEKGLEAELEEKYADPHLRDFFEISIGVSEPNKADINIHSSRFKTFNGHILFVSPVQSFSINFDKRIKKDKSKGFVIAFKAPFLVDKKSVYEVMSSFHFFNSHTFPQYSLSPSKLKSITNLVQAMYDEYVKGESHSIQIIKGYMEVLLYSFKRWITIDDIQKSSAAGELIAINFEREIIKDGNIITTVSNYASRLCISSNYLSECVKKYTGKTAQEVLLNHKLIVAKSLLSQHEKNIAQIAFEMGFTEPTNFTKFFKKMMNMSPNQFRNQK